MSDAVAAGRLILLIVAASYPLSAVLLVVLRLRGETVPWIWPAAWLVTGVAGLAIAWMMQPTATWTWWASLAVLMPIMVVSTVVDIRHGYWVIVALDVAGLAAIGYALWLARSLLSM